MAGKKKTNGGNGKKVTLPHLNQKNLNGHQLVLADEVAKIRDRWAARRGDGWQVVPEVRREAEQRARLGGRAPWAVGMAWAFTTFLILAVLNVIALAIFQETGHVASLPVALLWVSPMVIIPLVLFVVGTVKAKRRVSSTILGARTPAQLEDNLGAMEVTLSLEHKAWLDQLTEVELGYPHDLIQSRFIQDVADGGAKIDKPFGKPA